MYATLGIAGAIISEAALSFLGLGITEPTPSWGQILYSGKDVMGNHPIISTVSGIFILVTVLGFIMLAVAFVLGIIALVQKISGVALGGFTTVILLLLFSASVIMISLGIIGYYIARIYDEIKGRPRYIISRICGREDK